MTPDEQFNALVQLARTLEDDDEPLPADIENYVLTLSGTVAIGVRVAVRPRAVDRGK